MKKLLPFLFVFQLFISFSQAQTCVPPTGGSITGDVNGCVDRVGSYKVTGVNNATNYNWSFSGPAIATKITDLEYSLVFSGPGTVTITITPVNQTNGPCSGTALTKTVTVSSTPDKPVISQTGSSLGTGAATSYQWYLGSTLLTGQTGQTISPTQNGQYTVQIKNPAGCNIFSDPFNYTTTAIKEDNKFDGLTFYPNPVTTTIHVNFEQKFDIEFFDISGRKALQKTNLKGNQEIDLSNLNRGIYIMRVNSGGKYAVRKLILQ